MPAGTEMQELDESLLEPLPIDGITVPLFRMTQEERPPYFEVKLGGQAYRYERSYPIRGFSALLPDFIRTQMDAGKRPLLIERPQRYLVYLSI
jgi:hypothetical protein